MHPMNENSLPFTIMFSQSCSASDFADDGIAASHAAHISIDLGAVGAEPFTIRIIAEGASMVASLTIVPCVAAGLARIVAGAI